MTWSRPIAIVQKIGRNNSKQYINILDEYIKHRMEATCLLRSMLSIYHLISQQYINPKHSVRATILYLDSNGLKRMDWPAQSPDLIPIKHL